MRVCLCAIVLTLGSVFPAAASPISYSFTGTLGMAWLDTGEEIIDLSGSAFTVTGITGERFCFEDPYGCSPSWTGTSTYDFGALGSFTTAPGMDRYTERFDSAGNLIAVGLINERLGSIDYEGFMAFISPVAGGDRSAPVAFGTVQPIRTYASVGPMRNMRNAEGDRLSLIDGVAISPYHMQLTSVTTQPAPEPATLLLLTVGGAALLRRRT